jgi:outer membrane receptor for monomeric catechols
MFHVMRKIWLCKYSSCRSHPTLIHGTIGELSTKLKAHRVEDAKFREPIADTAKAVNKLIQLLSYQR